jgi:type I restriction enzyme, S subunit
MREEWHVERLGDIADINYGYTAKASFEYVGPKFLRITDIQEGRVDWNAVPTCPISEADLKKHRLQKDDIVFARTGATTGKSYRMSSPPEAVAASYLIRLRLHNKNIFPPFVSLYFHTKKYWDNVLTGTTGSAQGGFNASKLAELKLPSPPLPEQKRIVAILDEAFEKIDSAVANAEKNLANARELFEGYLNKVFTQKGEGWVEKAISEVILPSGTIDPRKKPKERFIYVDVSSVSNQTFKIVETSEMLGKEAPSRARRLMKSGDILFATIRPTLKRIARVPKELDGQVCSTGYFVFRTKPELSGEFLFHYLLSNTFMGEMESLQSGASYPAVNEKQVKQRTISFPFPSEQQHIISILDSLRNETQRLEAIYQRKLTCLTELKQSLLQKAFSGKLTADDTTIKEEAIA